MRAGVKVPFFSLTTALSAAGPVSALQPGRARGAPDVRRDTVDDHGTDDPRDGGVEDPASAGRAIDERRRVEGLSAEPLQDLMPERVGDGPVVDALTEDTRQRVGDGSRIGSLPGLIALREEQNPEQRR